jgi:hypothetical protein
LAGPASGTGAADLLRQLPPTHDWHQPSSTLVDQNGRTNPFAALDELRRRIRTRHYSYRTECSYADWVRRFFAYCSERQGVREPCIESDAVRDYLTHLAVRRRVSASTQNQAFSALLFLCREVLGLDVEGVADVARAKRDTHRPVVLSVGGRPRCSMPCTARLG